MSNEYDLEVAILDVARGDTGVGGLVPLSGGKTDPVVPWKDLGTEAPPVVSVLLVEGEVSQGAPAKMSWRARFDIHTPEGREDLDVVMADRLEALMTHTAFAAKGLDVRVEMQGRSDSSELVSEGRRRTVDFQMTLTR